MAARSGSARPCRRSWQSRIFRCCWLA
jgi:hypothetical protein